MKKIIILTGFIILNSAFLCINGQKVSASDGDNSITGYIDHVIATLPSRQFELLDSFLTVQYSFSWMNQPGVGYIVSRSQRPYVELWNAGVFFQGGYQVAFASMHENSKEIAKEYFGTSGIEFRGGVFNVGRNGQVGDPVGGTFFVDYGGGGKIPVKDSMKIEKFTGLITSIPVTKKDILNDYKFFNLTILEKDGIYSLKDTMGFIIQIIEEPIEAIAYGHVAFKFRLRNDFPERKEFILSRSTKVIIDRRDLILVLNSKLYDSFIAGQ